MISNFHEVLKSKVVKFLNSTGSFVTTLNEVLTYGLELHDVVSFFTIDLSFLTKEVVVAIDVMSCPK